MYVKPLQMRMEKVAPNLKVQEEGALERLKLLPKLMLGHILELSQVQCINDVILLSIDMDSLISEFLLS